MNPTMLAAAQIIKRARDVMHQAGQDPRLPNHAIVPDAEFFALQEALDDYETLEEMDNDRKASGG